MCIRDRCVWYEDVWNFNKASRYPHLRENNQSLMPAPPTGLTVVPGNRYLDVSWTKASGVNIYNAEWKKVTDTEWPNENKKEITEQENEFRITNLINNVEYDVRVRSKNLHKKGNWVSVTGTPFNPSAVPASTIDYSLSNADTDWLY